MDYIWATEALYKCMTRDRCQECHYFAHLHPFPNLVRDPKHGSRKVPRRNDLGDPAFCKHRTMLEVANLIAVVGGDTTAHEVRQRARCLRVTTRIRSSTRALQALLWMALV